MTSTRSALDADWLGVCRRAVTGLERMLAEVTTTEERALETGTRGSGGDRTLEIDRTAEQLVLDQLDGAAGRGLPVPGGVRGARRGRLRRLRCAGDHRSDRRLAERQARHLPPRAVDRRRRRRDDGGRRVRIRARLWPIRAVVGMPGPGRLARRRSPRPHAVRAPRPRRPARGAGDRIGRPALGGQIDRRPRRERVPPARARHDRGLAVPGGRRPLRRDGVAASIPGRRRRRRPADRARGAAAWSASPAAISRSARRSPPSRAPR